MFIRDQKRINIHAPYETPDGIRYGNLVDPYLRAAFGILEIPEPQPPADYSEDTHFRTEQDDAPYVVYTRKSNEQISQAKRARVLAQVAALEQSTMLPRPVREGMLSMPGAEQQPWFARVKAVDDEVAALRAALPQDHS
ncbi:MAG: hypothetical protein ING91_19495 [Rhodocyclaceae bacterium]|nr:hypothetical protein [Rhodocyclaceae bacterium]MCA3848774.1 hypothetical protein [Burkholderia sp.]